MGMQRGRGFGSVLGSIFRNVVVPAAKTVGKSLLRTGLKKASNVMRGVADGQHIGEAMVQEFIPQAGQNMQSRQPRQSRRVTPANRSAPKHRRRAQKRKRSQPMRGGKAAKVDIFTKKRGR